MSEWVEYQIANLIKDELLWIGDGYRAKNSELTASSTTGIPFARVKNVNGGFNFSDADFFPDENLSKIGNKVSQLGDIVFTSKGTVGRFAIVNDETRQFVYSPQLCFWRSYDDKFINPRFLFYWMHSREFFAQVEAVKGQTDMADYVSLSDQRQMKITLPALVEQEAITAVLASLDDKIDLLHRQNKTLEALAQTLFRHWFIDGADDNWEDGCLGDISENIRDGVKHDQVPNGTIYIGLEHIDKKNIALNRHGLSDDVNSNKYQFVEEDVLFGKLRPYFHKVCFTPFSGICSTDILVLRPKKPDYFCFSLFAFYQKDVIDYANLGSGGTRMPRTNWNTLKEYPISLPPEKSIKQFNDLIYPSIKKIRTNLAQIQTLEKLRDTLLPKLMSGEVRVRHQN